MKIGFDGKRAVQNNTGLGNYSRYVLEALQTYYPNEEYILYAPKKRKNPRLEPILSKDNTTLRLPTSTIWKRLSSLWRIWGASTDATNDGVSIFHGLSNELPLNIHRNPQIKSVLTIHDLIFRRLPQCYRFADRLIYNYKFRKSCQNADRIIAVSECTKRDIVKDYGISPDKIEVIYQGCDSAFAQIVDESKKEEVRSKYMLPEHYILSVGSIEERKNTLLIAKALKHLPKETHLVLVGKETAYTEKIRTYIKAENLESRVHILHGIPFADLPAIYQCAEVFAYPSRYEGFGIPILEALNSRLPVVAATGSCLEEAGGPDSLYVNPDDAAAMAKAIEKATTPAHREQMIEKGLVWAAQFSKEQMARQTMQCYNNLIKSDATQQTQNSKISNNTINHKKHIIHLVSNREWGGGEQYVYNLCQHFAADNYNVTIFCRPVKQVMERFALLNIAMHKLPLKGMFDLYSAVRLSSFLKNKECVIHVHNFKDAFTAAFARIISGNKNARIVLTRHLVRKGKTSGIYTWLYKQLDKIVFVSELAKNDFLSRGATIAPERITVIKNSIVIPEEMPKADIRKEFSLPEECTIAMYHGRIAHEKGLDVLIDAMQLLKGEKILLLLIGKGDENYHSQLQQRVKEYGLENNIKFIGYRSPVLPYLQECDFGILPSIVRESSSLSCMEYMSQGRPVIATNNGGQTEYLEHEKNSLLVPPADAEALAKEISELANNAEKRKLLGENALKDFTNKLNYNCFLKEIKKAYGY